MNWLFFFGGLGILLMFTAFLYLKSYIKRRTGTEQMLQSLREEIRLLEADIDLKTEQNLGLLEERIQTLRELIQTTEELRRETERRIAVYARELDRRRAQDTAFAALSASLPPSSPESSPPAEKAVSRRKKGAGGTLRGKANSLLDSIEVRELNAAHAIGSYQAQSAPAADAPENITPLNESSAPASETPLAAPPGQPDAVPPGENGAAQPRFIRAPVPVIPALPPLRERVAELYRAGFSEELIAARLGVTITEARLYMAMSEKP